MFCKQGDFGYVKERLSELKTYCEPMEQGDSKLECVDHLRMCRGKNLYFDFSLFLLFAILQLQKQILK